MSAWTDHVAQWKDCTRCPLHRQRDRIVLARGAIPSEVLFIGEAPGASEDALGQPFVGPAGRLLDQIIERSVPSTVRYSMTNLVACFPREAKERGDNEPSTNEIEACSPRLAQFVNVARPRLIVCVGTLSAWNIDHHRGVNCVDIVHPAFILARLPMAQKQMAVQKCIVTIRNAIEDMLESEVKFTEWGTEDAEVKSTAHRPRGDYQANDLPF